MNSRFFFFVSLVSLASITTSFGQGNDNPNGVTGDFSSVVTTGGHYTTYSGNAKRIVTDINTVPGCVGEYPLKWTRTSDSRRGPDPISGAFGNGGPWKYSYRWWFDNSLNFACPDGRILSFDYFNPDTNGWLGFPETGERLEIVTNTYPQLFMGEYNLHLADGGVVQFRHVPPATQSVVTKLIDPYGLETVLSYDPQGRLSRITEPALRYLQINYRPGAVPGPGNIIDSVQAWDGLGNVTQSVTYTYDTNGHTWLTRADYSDGTYATYTYWSSYPAPGNALKSCNDVRYAGPMGKIYYEFISSGLIGVGIALKNEKYSSTGPMVSQMAYPSQQVRTETRGDGPSRTCTWTVGDNVNYTDFKGQTSAVTYVDFPVTFTDARGNTIDYTNNPIGKVMA